MMTAICEPTSTLTMKAFEQAELNELVRGEDVRLLERVGPLVLNQSVTLDLASVERIDAAGITALLMLYRNARESGHCFSVTNASAHVAQILQVVGLDRFLLSHNAVQNSQYGSQTQRPAA
jgi:anti-anti-sigma factor